MSPVTDPSTEFSRSAGRQLLWFGSLAVLGFVGLMWLLSWAGNLGGDGNNTSEGVDPETDTITLVLREEPPQLDSTLATDQVSGMILGHVMEGLLRYDEHNQLAAGMADQWEINDSSAKFHIRESARWSDGTPVTAADFVFSWRQAVDPANASEYAFIMYSIKNAEAINQGELPVQTLGVKALDSQTLEVEFEQPIAYFGKLVAFTTYFPIKESFYRAAKGRYGADAKDLLYNGPFLISRWIHSAQLRLEKNPHYWDAQRVKIKVLDFPYLTTDTNASLNLFQDQKIAYTTLDTENIKVALQQRWHLEHFQDGAVFFMEFNHRPGRLTANRHLRKALQLALDNKELVYKVTKLPGYLPGESIFPVWLKGTKGYFRQQYPPNVDPVNILEARHQLELAKQTLGVADIPPLVMLSGDNPLSNKQSEYFQQVFKSQLGIEIKIDKQIFKQRLAKMTSGDFDMVLAGWGPDFDDPLTFADLFSSWNLNNRGRYTNPKLDQWVRVAQQSLDQDERMRAFAEIQRIIEDDVVIIINYERGIVYVTNPQLKGMVRRQVGPDPDFTSAYIDREAAL